MSQPAKPRGDGDGNTPSRQDKSRRDDAELRVPACDPTSDVPSPWQSPPRRPATKARTADATLPANPEPLSENAFPPQRSGIRQCRKTERDDDDNNNNNDGNARVSSQAWVRNFHDDGVVTADMPIAVRRFLTSAELASQKAFQEVLDGHEKDAIESMNGETFVRETVFTRLQCEYQYHVAELVDQLVVLKTQVRTLGALADDRDADAEAARSYALLTPRRATAGAAESPTEESRGTRSRARAARQSAKDIVLWTVVTPSSGVAREPVGIRVRGCIHCIRSTTLWFNIGAEVTFGELRSAWAAEAGQVAGRFQIWHRTGLIGDLSQTPGAGVFLDAGSQELRLEMRSRTL